MATSSLGKRTYFGAWQDAINSAMATMLTDARIPIVLLDRDIFDYRRAAGSMWWESTTGGPASL
jgi:hypothetical protein